MRKIATLILTIYVCQLAFALSDSELLEKMQLEKACYLKNTDDGEWIWVNINGDYICDAENTRAIDLGFPYNPYLSLIYNNYDGYCREDGGIIGGFGYSYTKSILPIWGTPQRVYEYKNGRECIIYDCNGNTKTFEIRADDINYVGDGIFAYRGTNGKYGLVDENGKILTPPQYDWLAASNGKSTDSSAYSEYYRGDWLWRPWQRTDLIHIRNGNKEGFIDIYGSVRVPLSSEYVYSGDDWCNFYYIYSNDNHGVISTDGKHKIACMYPKWCKQISYNLYSYEGGYGGCDAKIIDIDGKEYFNYYYKLINQTPIPYRNLSRDYTTINSISPSGIMYNGKKVYYVGIISETEQGIKDWKNGRYMEYLLDKNLNEVAKFRQYDYELLVFEPYNRYVLITCSNGYSKVSIYNSNTGELISLIDSCSYYLQQHACKYEHYINIVNNREQAYIVDVVTGKKVVDLPQLKPNEYGYCSYHMVNGYCIQSVSENNLNKKGRTIFTNLTNGETKIVEGNLAYKPSQGESFYFYDTNELYGVVDIAGNIIIPAQYRYIYRVGKNYFYIPEVSSIFYKNGQKIVQENFDDYTIWCYKDKTYIKLIKGRLKIGESESTPCEITYSKNNKYKSTPVMESGAGTYYHYNIALDEVQTKIYECENGKVIELFPWNAEPINKLNIANYIYEKLPSDVDINIPNNRKTNTNTFALIVANEQYYEKDIPNVRFAINDGEIFRKYCLQTLGIPNKNIRFCSNATLNQMRSAIHWINDVTNAYNGDAKVLIYYSGHGIPDEKTLDSYLLPSDGLTNDTRSGYSLKELYSELGALPAQNVSVFIDACFSGSSRNSTSLFKDAKAVAIKPNTAIPQGNMVIFSASQGRQTAYPYNEKKHGLFTYFLLKKLQETNGNVSYYDLSEYIISEVSKYSAVNGKSQTPTITPSTSASGWQQWKLK